MVTGVHFRIEDIQQRIFSVIRTTKPVQHVQKPRQLGMVERSRSVLDGFLAIGVKTLHEAAGEYELVQLQDHLVNVCGLPFHTGLLYGHGLVFPRNGSSVKRHEISGLSGCKAAQNPGLAMKFNQAISFHSLVHS